MKICPNCNKQLDDSLNFCDNCGAQVVNTVFCSNCGQQTAANAAACQNCGAPIAEAPAAAPAKAPFKLSKKLVSIGIAAIALILVVAIVLPMMFTSKPDSLFYVKEGEIWYTSASKIKPTLVADEPNRNSVYVTEDGKNAFVYNDGKLYYQSLTNTKKAPVSIGSVSDYVLSDSEKIIVYTTNDGKLYKRDITKEDKEKIASDVSNFKISKDAKNILYTVRESNGDEPTTELYIKKGNKEAVRIAKDIDTLQYTTDNLGTVYYSTEDALYKWNGKEAAKIADDLYNVIIVHESGDAYYVKADKDKDDIVTGKSLYYFDGKKETKLTDSFGETISGTYDKSVLIYTEENKSDNNNTTSSDSSEDKARTFIAIKDKTTEMEFDDVNSVRFDEKGKTLYFIADMQEADSSPSADSYKIEVGTLYSMKISGKPGKAEKIDTDVYRYGFTNYYENNKIYYVKNYDSKTSTYDLYINKKLVDSDVYNDVSFADGVAYYYADYDNKNYEGTLRYSKGGTGKTIASDVYKFDFAPSGDVMYLTNKDSQGEGDLYVFKGSGKPKMVDTDVSGIISASTKEEKRAYENYGWWCI